MQKQPTFISIEFGQRIARFLTSLDFSVSLPPGFEVLNPYVLPEVQSIVETFCARYYTDAQPRLAMWGINPGRFGAGITGLSFTDPFALRNTLGIESKLDGRRELSAEFIYHVIDAYGGPEKFYRDVYMSALSPLGFVRHGVNINFYDDAKLMQDIVPFIRRCVKMQQSFGLRPDVCVVLGTGKLRTFMERHVRHELSYTNVVYLEHPRYIMQYRRSLISDYVAKYVDTIAEIVSSSYQR